MNNFCHRHDMSGVLWDKLEPLILGTGKTRGVRGVDNRKFINTVFWILRTGVPWRNLPKSYSDWKNTHHHFCRWCDKMFGNQYLKLSLVKLITNGLLIDASFVKAHQHVHGAVGGSQDIGLSKGGNFQDSSCHGFNWSSRLLDRAVAKGGDQVTQSHYHSRHNQ